MIIIYIFIVSYIFEHCKSEKRNTNCVEINSILMFCVIHLHWKFEICRNNDCTSIVSMMFLVPTVHAAEPGPFLLTICGVCGVPRGILRHRDPHRPQHRAGHHPGYLLRVTVQQGTVITTWQLPQHHLIHKWTRRNSSALAMELRFVCIKPLIGGIFMDLSMA